MLVLRYGFCPEAKPHAARYVRSSIAVALRSTLHMRASDGPVNYRAVSRSHKNMLGSLGHADI